MQYSGYHTITPLVIENLTWDPVKDFVPIANVLTAPQLIVVRVDLPIHSLTELVAYAKENPGKLNYATPGAGSLGYLTGELLKQRTGIEMTQVPYKGMAPAIIDLLNGTVDLTFSTASSMIGQLQAGKLRALAVTGKTRLSLFPDVPTVDEVGFQVLDAPVWFAVFGPKSTPKIIVTKLGAEIANVMKTEDFKRKAAEQGAESDYKNSAELAGLVQFDLSRWAQVIKAGKIKQ
jgi:tripartite-type tricarboxylate transporter receptor subunit TctC